MKKIVSMILALMLVMSLAVSAAATGDTLSTEKPVEYGSITIIGASEENVYSVYRMLDLESYNKNSGAYAYKVNKDWADFFATDAAKAYFSIDSAGYATWVGSESSERVIAFSQLALQYAQDPAHPIKCIQTSKDIENFITTQDNVHYGKFENLVLGYYLVDSTMGALCGLTTTNPDADITAKNKAPELDKQVQEDSSEQWGESNTAGIGEKVEYRVRITVTGGAQNYALHDTMTEGLTFNPTSVAVTLNKNTVAAEGNFEVDADPDDDCTFDITFSKDFCKALKDGDEILVTYNATLNEKAKIGTETENLDSNKARLEFGEEHFTSYDSVTTSTFGIEIVKTNDQSTQLLPGAEFLIYDAKEGGNVIPVVAVKEGEQIVGYRLAVKGEVGEVIKVINGRIKVNGFDANKAGEDYWLEEVTAPEGYNQLTERQSFHITNGNLYGTFNGESYTPDTGVQVKNKTGTILPSTGAMGTTMFLTFGSLVVMATGVLLITKKRMAMIEE